MQHLPLTGTSVHTHHHQSLSRPAEQKEKKKPEPLKAAISWPSIVAARHSPSVPPQLPASSTPYEVRQQEARGLFAVHTFQLNGTRVCSTPLRSIALACTELEHVQA